MTDRSTAELAREHGLMRMGARPPLIEYFKQAWSRRWFAWAMSRYAVEARNSRSRLGVIWVVARPLLLALTFGLVFGFILQGFRPPDFISYLFVGVFVFEFFSKSFSEGARSITSNTNLVASLSFPRILLPLSAVLRNFIEFVPTMALLLLIVWTQGHWPRLEWLLVLPMMLMFAVFNTGVALIAARLTVHLSDLSNLIPFVTRITFYLSGIFYEFERIFPADAIELTLVRFNPIYDFICVFRAFITDGSTLVAQQWWVIGISTPVLLILGVIFFWQAEERYGRE